MARIHGTNASESLYGTHANDSITGHGGDDTLYGYGGNDYIAGGYGADTIIGGTGVDTATYEDSNTGVYVALAEGNNYGSGAYGTAQGDRLWSIEKTRCLPPLT